MHIISSCTNEWCLHSYLLMLFQLGKLFPNTEKVSR